jgi:hypothetical protein
MYTLLTTGIGEHVQNMVLMSGLTSIFFLILFN